MKKDYAAKRGALLEQLDGLSVQVDKVKKIGYLMLDRPPLNIVSYTARSQICAIIEAMDDDDEVGVIVIRGAGNTFTSGGDVKKFPEIPFINSFCLVSALTSPVKPTRISVSNFTGNASTIFTCATERLLGK